MKRGDNWVGMWRLDVIQPDGSLRREQRSKAFVGLSERGARAKFQPILDAVNAANHATPPVPNGTATLGRLVADWREQIAGTRKARCYTLEEMQKIVCSCDEPLATICFILSVTGMRIGEVLALRVEDLDFRRKLLNVRCSTYAGQIGTPKSAASIADLLMPAALEARLEAYLQSRHYHSNDLGLLFMNRRGRPFSANKLREKKLRPLLAELGIPLAGFHAFRHAVASELIDSGAPITVVQAQLRHSDPRITLGLYGHVIPQSQREAVSNLADRLGGQLLTPA